MTVRELLARLQEISPDERDVDVFCADLDGNLLTIESVIGVKHGACLSYRLEKEGRSVKATDVQIERPERSKEKATVRFFYLV